MRVVPSHVGCQPPGLPRWSWRRENAEARTLRSPASAGDHPGGTVPTRRLVGLTAQGATIVCRRRLTYHTIIDLNDERDEPWVAAMPETRYGFIGAGRMA